MIVKRYANIFKAQVGCVRLAASGDENLFRLQCFDRPVYADDERDHIIGLAHRSV